jgi:hypothetical protein
LDWLQPDLLVFGVGLEWFHLRRVYLDFAQPIQFWVLILVVMILPVAAVVAASNLLKKKG